MFDDLLPARTPAALARKMDLLSQIFRGCAVDGVDEHGRAARLLSGTMMGWWEGVAPTETIRKARVSPDAVQLYASTLTPAEVSQVVRYHFFCFLVGILQRPGKNEFILSTGERVAIDNDRVSFDEFEHPKMINLAACQLCTRDKSDIELFQTACMHAPTSDDVNFDSAWTVASVLNATLSTQPLSPPLHISSGHALVMHRRISAVDACLRTCSLG
mmetsp:Transcript_17429/g.44392  ORF Transcript_17429/g.44392 Transcript_17429/m.44392 type:complete len:216 (+) Transcript_17429:296-943(+)